MFIPTNIKGESLKKARAFSQRILEVQKLDPHSKEYTTKRRSAFRYVQKLEKAGKDGDLAKFLRKQLGRLPGVREVKAAESRAKARARKAGTHSAKALEDDIKKLFKKLTKAQKAQIKDLQKKMREHGEGALGEGAVESMQGYFYMLDGEDEEDAEGEILKQGEMYDGESQGDSLSPSARALHDSQKAIRLIEGTASRMTPEQYLKCRELAYDMTTVFYKGEFSVVRELADKISRFIVKEVLM